MFVNLSSSLSATSLVPQDEPAPTNFDLRCAKTGPLAAFQVAPDRIPKILIRQVLDIVRIADSGPSGVESLELTEARADVPKGTLSRPTVRNAGRADG